MINLTPLVPLSNQEEFGQLLRLRLEGVRGEVKLSTI